MKKLRAWILIIFLVVGVVAAGMFFVQTNQQSAEIFETDKPYITTINDMTVVTGRVIPENEVVIVPQLSGILVELLVEEGDVVKAGDLIAKIKVVPDEASLNSAKGRVRNAELVSDDAVQKHRRSKALYDKKLISKQAYDDVKLSLSQAKQNLNNARNDLMIIESGTTGTETTNTLIRATIAGTVLEIPVEEGDQLIESNNFNNGTTIAIIANLTDMIFEGSVDEADVNKLTIGMPITINLAAIGEQGFDATLRFIAPKGTEESGSVQFTIRADVVQDENYYVRAGYSANASIILEQKTDVLTVNEALLQFDNKTGEPYVEIRDGEAGFKRQDVVLGISDGLQVEVVSGLDKTDLIKVWNKTEKRK